MKLLEQGAGSSARSCHLLRRGVVHCWALLNRKAERSSGTGAPELQLSSNETIYSTLKSKRCFARTRVAGAPERFATEHRSASRCPRGKTAARPGLGSREAQQHFCHNQVATRRAQSALKANQKKHCRKSPQRRELPVKRFTNRGRFRSNHLASY
jgi:hypothetical protein